MTNPPKPEPPYTQQLIEDSNLRLVLVGGINIGVQATPRRWVLRPKDERQREAQRAKDLQRLAAAARKEFKLATKIQELEAEIRRGRKLHAAAKELEQFLGKNAGDNSDWPIEITADEEYANELCRLLNNLKDAVGGRKG